MCSRLLLRNSCKFFIIHSLFLIILSFYFDSLEQKESHLAFLCYKLSENRPFFKEWPLENLREIQRRRYILRKTALELFFLDGTTILVNFPENNDSEELSQKLIRLRKTKCVNLQYYKTLDAKKLVEKTAATKKWLAYELSNFDYLMILNGLAGRSYKDVTQYPVFPWVLTNEYKVEATEKHEEVYRDFSKTMGAMVIMIIYYNINYNFYYYRGMKRGPRFLWRGTNIMIPIVRYQAFITGAIIQALQ